MLLRQRIAYAINCHITMITISIAWAGSWQAMYLTNN